MRLVLASAAKPELPISMLFTAVGRFSPAWKPNVITLPLPRAYLGDGAAVVSAAGAFCGVEVLLLIFFDRLRTFAPFSRWMLGITIILSVTVCSYGVEGVRGSGPV